MISKFAYFIILGKPLTFWLGITTLLSFLSTAYIGMANLRGNNKIPFKWHPRMAKISITLAIIHGLLAASIYF